MLFAASTLYTWYLGVNIVKLHSLNDIFERRLFRIPDYQRGYAWQVHQLEDFWEDIEQLSSNKIHYVGVLTIEPVQKSVWDRWDEDCWLIDDVGYKPFYIVDGQQRITTSMILLQTIIEVINADEKLNYQSITDIREQFILKDAEDGQRKSFLFGYEKDNPSDEFMKRPFSEFTPTSISINTHSTLAILRGLNLFLRAN